MTDRITQIKSFLEAQPGDSFLLHALGLEYCKLGDDQAARKIFESLLQANPGYVGTYYQLAKLLERTGETEAAINVYENGIKAAETAGDAHSLRELKAALEDLIY